MFEGYRMETSFSLLPTIGSVLICNVVVWIRIEVVVYPFLAGSGVKMDKKSRGL